MAVQMQPEVSHPLQALANKHATVAWCPIKHSKPFIAMASNGTQGISGDFQAPELKIELAKFDIGSGSQELSIINGVTIQDKVNALSWSIATPGHDMGLIAAGTANGAVQIWSPHMIGQGNQDGALVLEAREDSAITSLEWHYETNKAGGCLLAVGTQAGNLSLYNVDGTSNHMESFSPCGDNSGNIVQNGHQNQAVSGVSWNLKVPHIVASCCAAGNVCVWDLRSKKMVTHFKDNNVQRYQMSSVAWHPNEPTQLCVAYEDDRNPAIQFWDLRKSQSPYLEVQGHTKGISSLSWNTQDWRLLMSCGKDNRTVCWCLNTQAHMQPEIFSEIVTSQWCSEGSWCPTSPGIFSATTANGAVAVFSAMMKQNSPHYTPDWMQRPCGATFGFGGKMTTFGLNQKSAVSVHMVPNEPEVVAGANNFEQWLAQGDLGSFARHMATTTQDEHEKKTWDLMSMLFQDNWQNEVVGKMGFEKQAVLQAAEKYLGQPPGSLLGTPQADESTQAPAPTNSHPEPSLDAEGAENFFENLAVSHEQKEREEIERRESLLNGVDVDALQQSASDWTRGPERVIKESLLIGDLATAVECCLKAGRMADALLLASGGDAELFNRTKEEYMKRSEDTFLKTVGCIMNGDLDSMVTSSDLDRWQETLAIIATYAKSDKARYQQLCVALGERLRTEKFDVRSAVFCNLAAADFSGTVEIWSSMSASNTQRDALESIVQKMAVLQQATRFNGSDKQFTERVSSYAEVLANSGCLTSAMRYLSLLTSAEERSEVLKERIYNAVAPQVVQQLNVRPPNFPFQRVEVRPQVIQQTQPQHQQQQQHGKGGQQQQQYGQQQQQQQQYGQQQAKGQQKGYGAPQQQYGSK